MSGADIILRVLAEQGVDTLFGYSGGAILPTYDAVFRFNEMHAANPERQIKFVVPANEQAAGFMAAGYARASGKVGVFMVTSGPGATNAVTPIADCNGDSVPVVLICGQVPRAAIGTDAFQEAPVFNIMSACAKQVFLVTDPAKLEQTLRTAFEIARTGRPGPVVVDVPKDIQNWMGPYHGTRHAAVSRLFRSSSNDGKRRSSRRGQARRILRSSCAKQTAAFVCRRRRDRGRRDGRAAPVLRALSHSRRDDAHGSWRNARETRTVAWHAGHAWRCLRELRGRRLRLPDCSGRPIR